VDVSPARRFPEAEAELKTVLTLDAGPGVQAHAHMFLGSALCAQNRVGEGVPHLTRALVLDPTLADAHALLGEAYDGTGQRSLAARHFMAAVESTPDNPLLLRRTAWFLATSPEDELRNGPKAVELAERARRLTSGRDPVTLESLGAAYAEVGRFGDAEAVLREAILVAQSQGQAAFVPVFEQQQALYGARRPLRLPSVK
jgi:Flp pilus assembly protein TadD